MPEAPQGEANNEERVRKEIGRRIKAMQVEQQKRDFVKRFLSDEAYERLMNVRLSNKDLYDQMLNLIIAMAQSNRISKKLTEEQLKSLIGKVSFRPEPKLEFKHK